MRAERSGKPRYGQLMANSPKSRRPLRARAKRGGESCRANAAVAAKNDVFAELARKTTGSIGYEEDRRT